MNKKTKIRILLFEDNAADALLLEEALADLSGVDFELTRAERLADGLNRLRNEKYDVALLDLGLPDSSGAETFIQFRKEEPGVPLLVLTGLDNEELGLKAMQEGAQDYLVKNKLQPSLLGRSIRYAVERHRVSEELDRRARKLAESEARTRMIIDANADAVLIVDWEGQIQFVNPAAERLFGLNVEDLMFLPFPQIKDQRPELTIERKEGEPVIAEIRVVETVWNDAPAYLASLRDITERKRGERRLVVRNEITRALAESISLSEAAPKILQTICEAEGWDFGTIWEVDKQSDVLRCEEVWHIPEESFDVLEFNTRVSAISQGEGLPGNVWKESRPILVKDLKQTANYPLAAIAVRAGLQSALGFPIQFGGEVKGVVNFFSRGIREPDRKLLDMFDVIGDQIGQFIERRLAQEQLRKFVSLNPSILYALSVDKEGVYPNWTSENICSLTGYGTDESIRKGWWAEHLHPDDRERILAAHPIPYEIDHQILEYRFQRKDGSYFWVRDEKRLQRDFDGDPVEIVGSWSDITDKVQLEEQYRHAQKMEAIGRLSGGVAHDFNNILSIILGQISLLDLRKEIAPNLQGAMDEIKQAAERAANLTRQLLMFSRRQTMQLRNVDLNDAVAGMNKMLQRILGEDIQMKLNCLPKPLPLRADEGMIDQILLNLAVNARDAMPRGGRLVIETSEAFFDEQDALLSPQMKPGEYVCLSVGDTGIGISEEDLPRIFEPFFTTKEIGKGTGLGLATVFGIVEQHKGQITVRSEVGKGTEFRIYFPRMEKAKDETQESETLKSEQGGNETILFVEDEPTLRALVGMYLSDLGYEVLEAGTGPSALMIWEQHKDKIRLVMTDVVMPGGMTGIELARRIHGEAPKLKFIFTSGYHAELAGIDFPLIEGLNFLAKPYDAFKLAQKLRESLNASD